MVNGGSEEWFQKWSSEMMCFLFLVTRIIRPENLKIPWVWKRNWKYWSCLLVLVYGLWTGGIEFYVVGTFLCWIGFAIFLSLKFGLRLHHPR